MEQTDRQEGSRIPARLLESDLGDTFADVLADHVARMETSQANCDPLLIMVARETAAELLADYLAHVATNRAARNLISAARKEG